MGIMGARSLALTALLAACYQPSTSPGAPCGPSGECPSGLACVADRCVLPGTPGDAPPLDDASAGTMDAAADASTALGPWGTPIDLDFTVGSETDPSMTQDRLTLVFMSEADEELYIAKRPTPTGTFTVTKLFTLNSSAMEKSPEISADGLTIYFVSERIMAGDYDIYRSAFTTFWSPPIRVPELSGGDTSDIAISPDGLTAIICDLNATDRFRIHTRASTSVPFGAGMVHPELSGPTNIAGPTITNGGAVVYLHAGNTRDIYVAYRTMDGTYTTPVEVPELNSSGGRNAAPFVLQDNRHMVFERDGDIYEVSR